MRVHKRWVIWMVCLLLAVPAIARAQTGAAITGVVRDTSGAVMPGVTVEAASPALIEQVRTAVSDDQGNYRITELRPGVYSVTFTLTGFSTVKREGIELSAGFTAPVNAELKVGSLEETITVTGATPVVDVSSARTQNVMKAETLEALPSAMRDLTSMAGLTLGATPSTAGRNDVGGDKAELSTGLSIHGSRGDDSRTNYDGMNTNVFFGGAGGQQRTYKFNTVGVAETTIDTSASGAETETGGANINMVPKDGGNRFSFLGSLSYTDENLASGAVPQELIDRDPLRTDNLKSMKKVYDYGIGVGGPIKRDRLWFYSANRIWGNQSYGGNIGFNVSRDFWRYEQDDRRVYGDQYYKDFSVRLTLQATSKHKFTFTEGIQTGCACWMAIGGTTAPEATVSFAYGGEGVPVMSLNQGTWTYPATNRLLFQAGGSFLRQYVSFTSRGGPELNPGQKALRFNDVFTGLAWGNLGGSVTNDLNEPQNNNNTNYRFAVSYVTGSHAYKVGIQGMRGNYKTRGNLEDGISYTLNNGVSQQITLWAVPFRSEGRINSFAAYLSDQWAINRLTISYGVRYDQFHAYTEDITLPAGPFRPERSYIGEENIPNYKDITPRVSASYDLFGNGKTAIKGAWGRYLVGLGGGAFNFMSPSNAIVNSATRTWNDSFFPVGDARRGNFLADCDFTNAAANQECGLQATTNFGDPRVQTTWDDRARQGWFTREYNNQWSVTLQHELAPNFGVTTGFFHTAWGNQMVVVNGAATAADYTKFCVNAPTDDRMGSISGQQVCGFYDQNRTLPVQNVWMRTSDVPGVTGKRTDTYNGGELGVNWRYMTGGLLTGGLSLGRQTTDDCYANDQPQIQQNLVGLPSGIGTRADTHCRIVPALWNAIGSQVKLQAIYPLPYDFVISAAYKNVPGVPLSATVNYTAAQTTLGRAFINPAAGNGLSLMIPQDEFDTRLNQVDFRGTRRFRLKNNMRVNAVLELYNAFNARPSQGNNAAFGNFGATPNPTFRSSTNILGGRLFKFGATVDF